MTTRTIDLSTYSLEQFIAWIIDRESRKTFYANTKYQPTKSEDWEWQDDPSGEMEEVEDWSTPGPRQYKKQVKRIRVKLPVKYGLTYSGNYGTFINLSPEVGELLCSLWKTGDRWPDQPGLQTVFKGYRDLTSIAKLLGQSDAKDRVASAKAAAEQKDQRRREIQAAKNIIEAIATLGKVANTAGELNKDLLPSGFDLGSELIAYQLKLERMIETNERIDNPVADEKKVLEPAA